MISTRNQYDGAFTRIELLTVITVVGLLALTQWAGFARHGQVSQAAICLNNLSQLQRAWQLYADDHGGRIVAAQRSNAGLPGWADVPELVLGEPYIPRNRLKWTLLWPYTSGEPNQWRCPNDPATFALPRTGIRYPTLRSYSMNNWVNGNAWPFSGSGWQIYRKLEDMNDPGPANTAVLLETFPVQANHTTFVIDMAGFPFTPVGGNLIDRPAINHNPGSSVSFADGHVELRRWVDSRTIKSYAAQTSGEILDQRTPNNPDVRWLQERATRQISSSN